MWFCGFLCLFARFIPICSKTRHAATGMSAKHADMHQRSSDIRHNFPTNLAERV
jgi:hypothetical protein